MEDSHAKMRSSKYGSDAIQEEAEKFTKEANKYCPLSVTLGCASILNTTLNSGEVDLIRFMDEAFEMFGLQIVEM